MKKTLAEELRSYRNIVTNETSKYPMEPEDYDGKDYSDSNPAKDIISVVINALDFAKKGHSPTDWLTNALNDNYAAVAYKLSNGGTDANHLERMYDDLGELVGEVDGNRSKRDVVAKLEAFLNTWGK
jgi:hypothetical protein